MPSSSHDDAFPRFGSDAEFAAWLKKGGVPVERLGKNPGTKTISEFRAEVEAGECRLYGNPRRRVVAVATATIRPEANAPRCLLELEQRFPDRPTRRRKQELGEKLKPGEDPSKAIVRGIVEELGVAADNVFVDKGSHCLKVREAYSASYLLKTRYELHFFDAVVTGLPDADFERADAAEDGALPKKSHVWGWRENPLPAAEQAVRLACEVTRNVQQHMVSDDTIEKADRSPVTVADLAAQAVISILLERAFPDIPLMAEEDAEVLVDRRVLGQVLAFVQQVLPGVEEAQLVHAIRRGDHGGGGGRFWVLDPIDGTKGFLRRQQYAVCLALLDGGEIPVAVVGCPALPVAAGDSDGGVGCLFSVQGARPVYCQRLGDPSQAWAVHVSDVSDPSEAAFVESVEAAHADHGLQGEIAEGLGIHKPPARLDSQAKFIAVARGDADIYLRFARKAGYTQKLWDIAPGKKIVEAAGGQITDAFGRPLDLTTGRRLAVGSLFATNGHLHERVSEVVGAVFKEP